MSAFTLVGTGDGHLETGQTVFESQGGITVATGDLNTDHTPDLAVATGGAPGDNGYVGVALGNGDGTFRDAQQLTDVQNPGSVAIGDFNGDGKPDLAVTGYRPSLSVMLGDGDGTFGPAQSVVPTGSDLASPVVADLNGDGKADLVVFSAGGLSSDTVSVLLGNGDGTFQPQQTFAVGTWPQSVAVGDFNADGKPDLAVANLQSNNVSVLLGNGDGTFRPQQTFAAGTAPRSVAVGDFNADGKPDLAVANFESSDVSILLGKGDGTFQTQQTFLAGPYPESVAVADFNGDDKPDLAVGGNGLWVLLDVILAPRVATGAAVDHGATGATLHGTLNPLDSDIAARYYFEYGATPAYRSRTPSTAAAAGSRATKVSWTVSELRPSTTYQYRLVATNPGGLSYGADRTFRTAPRLSALRIIPSRFRALVSGPSLTRRPGLGASVRYWVSEHGAITFTLEKVVAGRRQGRLCRPATPTRASLPGCTRYLRLRGSFRYTSKDGRNRFTFTGRLHQTLTPGRYVLIAIARGRTGELSKPVRANFTIRR